MLDAYSCVKYSVLQYNTRLLIKLSSCDNLTT